jgi:hypothetical protein
MIKYDRPLYDESGSVGELPEKGLCFLKADRGGTRVLARASLFGGEEWATSNLGNYCAILNIPAQAYVRMSLPDKVKTKAGKTVEFRSGDAGYLFHGSFDLSGSGKLVAAAATGPGRDGQIVVWDADTGKIKLIRGVEPPVSRVLFSPDGRTLALGGYDGLVRFFDLGSASLLDIPKAEGARNDLGAMVESLAWSADGRTLYSGHADGRIQAWDFKKDEPIGLFALQSGAVTCLEASPDGKTLYAGDYAKKLRIFDVATKGLVKEVSASAYAMKDDRASAASDSALTYSQFDLGVDGKLIAWGPLLLTARGNLIGRNALLAPNAKPCFVMGDELVLYNAQGQDKDGALLLGEDQERLSYFNIRARSVYHNFYYPGSHDEVLYRQDGSGEWELAGFSYPQYSIWRASPAGRTKELVFETAFAKESDFFTEFRKRYSQSFAKLYDPDLGEEFFANVDFLSKASALLAKGRTAEARAAFSYCVSKDIVTARAYAGLGLCYQEERNYPLAKASFQKALELEPSLDPCYANLAKLALREGKGSQALYYLSKGEAYKRGDPDYCALYGSLLMEKGQYGAAVPFLLNALALQPEGDDSYCLLFACYEKLGLTMQRDTLLEAYRRTLDSREAVKASKGGSPAQSPQQPLLELAKGLPQAMGDTAAAVRSAAIEGDSSKAQAVADRAGASVAVAVNTLIPAPLMAAYERIKDTASAIQKGGGSVPARISDRIPGGAGAVGALDEREASGSEGESPMQEAAKAIDSFALSFSSSFPGGEGAMKPTSAEADQLKKAVDKDAAATRARPFDEGVARLERLAKADKDRAYEQAISAARTRDEENAKKAAAGEELKALPGSYAAYDGYIKKWGGFGPASALVKEAQEKKRAREDKDRAAFGNAEGMPETSLEGLRSKIAAVAGYSRDYPDGLALKQAQGDAKRLEALATKEEAARRAQEEALKRQEEAKAASLEEKSWAYCLAKNDDASLSEEFKADMWYAYRYGSTKSGDFSAVIIDGYPLGAFNNAGKVSGYFKYDIHYSPREHFTKADEYIKTYGLLIEEAKKASKPQAEKAPPPQKADKDQAAAAASGTIRVRYYTGIWSGSPNYPYIVASDDADGGDALDRDHKLEEANIGNGIVSVSGFGTATIADVRKYVEECRSKFGGGSFYWNGKKIKFAWDPKNGYKEYQY